jgi:hypothetical protein
MDGSKNGQAGASAAVLDGAPATAAVAKGPTTLAAVPTRAPAVVPIGVPTAIIVAKGPAVPAVGPAGTLAPATKKGRPASGWGCQRLRQHPQRAHERQRRQPEG